MLYNKKSLLDRLINLNIVGEDIYQNLKEVEDIEKVESYLIKQGIVTAEDLTKIKAEIFNLPYIDLREFDIDPEILDIFPNDILMNQKIIPFKKEGAEISVALLDPQDFRGIQAVEFLIKQKRWKVKYYLMSEDSFRAVVKKNSTLGQEVQQALGAAEDKYTADIENELDKKEGDLGTIKGAPISKIVSVIIRHAVEGRASDIHIEPGNKQSKVRYRVDGILHTSLTLPAHVHPAIISRIKIMANLKIDETRIPQDGRIRLNIDGRQVDFRVSIFPLMGNEKAVLRVLDTLKGIMPLTDLGFNERHINMIQENIKASNGMLLLTGPTGSGKTTTLYSVLNILNQDGVNIITLEDPVEYFFPGVNQSQIRAEIGYTFAAGLRSILRQDPDIIMVGEIRDNETAELAVHASLTGHFVLSTLHTNSAPGAVPRLIDMGVEPFLLSSTLRIVVAQRLARKICQNCKVEIPLSDTIKDNILKEIKDIPEIYLKDVFNKNKNEITKDDIKFFKGEGCEECGGKGYKSRCVVAEILLVTEDVKEAMSNGYNEEKMKEALKKQNMITLKQDGILKSLQGITTMEEVMRVTTD